MATGYLRVAHESIAGNEANSPTLSTKKVFVPLLSYEPDPGISHLRRNDELVNTDQPRPALPLMADPSWSARTRAYPDALGMGLTCMLGLPTTTAGNGVITDPDAVVIPVGAHRHVWTAPFGPAGSSPMTAQHDIGYSAESVFFKAKGAAIQQLTLETPTDDGVMLGMSGPALYFTNQSDPSLTPAYEGESIPPFLRPQAGLSWGLSGTADTRDLSVTITNPVTPEHTFGSGSKWPDKIWKGNAPILVSGSIPKSLIDADDYNGLVSATGFTVTAKWISTAIIASAYPYKLFLQSDTNGCQYLGGGPAPLTNERRRQASFTFEFSRVSGAAATISLINATAAYV